MSMNIDALYILNTSLSEKEDFYSHLNMKDIIVC